ncbi:MAG: HD domain-containing protein [Anaerovoracaceae bacterium]
MKRLLVLQGALLNEIARYEGLVTERDQPMDWERVHMASCARLGYILAQKRGVDPDLASFACAVHDYGRIITGKQKDHSEAGYLPVQKFLKELGIFSDEEIDIISIAVKNHSNKAEVGGPIEEIVKDADVIDCYQYGLGFSREEQRIRYEKFLEDSQSL